MLTNSTLPPHINFHVLDKKYFTIKAYPAVLHESFNRKVLIAKHFFSDTSKLMCVTRNDELKFVSICIIRVRILYILKSTLQQTGQLSCVIEILLSLLVAMASLLALLNALSYKWLRNYANESYFICKNFR